MVPHAPILFWHHLYPPPLTQACTRHFGLVIIGSHQEVGTSHLSAAFTPDSLGEEKCICSSAVSQYRT